MAHRPREVTRGSKRTGKQAYEKLERIVLSAQPVEGEGAKRKTPLHLSLAEFRHLRTDYERAHGRPPLCIELLFAGSAFVHLARGRKTVRADHFLAVAKQSTELYDAETALREVASPSKSMPEELLTGEDLRTFVLYWLEQRSYLATLLPQLKNASYAAPEGEKWKDTFVTIARRIPEVTSVMQMFLVSMLKYGAGVPMKLDRLMRDPALLPAFERALGVRTDAELKQLEMQGNIFTSTHFFTCINLYQILMDKGGGITKTTIRDIAVDTLSEAFTDSTFEYMNRMGYLTPDGKLHFVGFSMLWMALSQLQPLYEPARPCAYKFLLACMGVDEDHPLCPATMNRLLRSAVRAKLDIQHRLWLQGSVSGVHEMLGIDIDSSTPLYTQEVIKAASRHPARAKSHVEAMASQVLKYLIYEREAAPPPPSLEPSEGMLRQNGRAVDATRAESPTARAFSQHAMETVVAAAPEALNFTPLAAATGAAAFSADADPRPVTAETPLPRSQSRAFQRLDSQASVMSGEQGEEEEGRATAAAHTAAVSPAAESVFPPPRPSPYRSYVRMDTHASVVSGQPEEEGRSKTPSAHTTAFSPLSPNPTSFSAATAESVGVTPGPLPYRMFMRMDTPASVVSGQSNTDGEAPTAAARPVSPDPAGFTSADNTGARQSREALASNTTTTTNPAADRDFPAYLRTIGEAAAAVAPIATTTTSITITPPHSVVGADKPASNGNLVRVSAVSVGSLTTPTATKYISAGDAEKPASNSNLVRISAMSGGSLPSLSSAAKTAHTVLSGSASAYTVYSAGEE